MFLKGGNQKGQSVYLVHRLDELDFPAVISLCYKPILIMKMKFKIYFLP